MSFRPSGGGNGAPSGPAGGDLSGTYPDPSVVNNSHLHDQAISDSVVSGSITVPGGSVVTFDAHEDGNYLYGGNVSVIPAATAISGDATASTQGLYGGDTNLYGQAVYVDGDVSTMASINGGNIQIAGGTSQAVQSADAPDSGIQGGEVRLSAGNAELSGGNVSGGSIITISPGRIDATGTPVGSDIHIDVSPAPGGALIITGLPTADPTITNALWSDGGTIKQSAG